jgi:molybdopterin-binding protein
MKFGARNKISATVTEVKTGSVMSQVNVEVAGPIAMSSVLTTDSLKDLGIKAGDKVRVIVKAVSVLLVKE